ncbi:hypothetical protein KR215_010419, partial [Drosophila sulfurigaster]
LGKLITGLMDTGASINCIGGKLAEEILTNNTEYTRLSSAVKTADGNRQRICGKLVIPVQFKGKTHSQRFYIVPTLSQDLYLGIEFWRDFELLPMFLMHQAHSNSIASITFNDPQQLELTSEQKTELITVINQFPSFAEKGLGNPNWLTHDIEVTDCKPIKQRHYAVSPAVEKLMYHELDRMLALGVIEESDSPWSAPVVLVQKPGKVRLCLDSRKVNEVTIKNAYPMPLIDGILSRLPKAEFISSIDLKDAYWQIPLS